MKALREWLALFDSDDIGDAVLVVFAICGIAAMLGGWL